MVIGLMSSRLDSCRLKINLEQLNWRRRWNSTSL